jgi:hypothetical protein
MVPVELHPGDADGFVEIIVGQGRVQNRVAVFLEISRLYAAPLSIASRGGIGSSS